MSNATWAHGSTLTSPAGAIAELDTIGVFAPRAETMDVTTHDNVDGYREFLGGLRDGGELSLAGNFYPGAAPQIAMKTYLDDGAVRAFTVTMPAAMGSTITLNGIVTGLDIGPFPVDGKVAFGGTIKITGKPSVNVTASVGITALSGNEPLPAVLDFVPNFLAGVLTYAVTVDTTSGTVTLNVTAAGVITATALGIVYGLISTIESGAIAIGGGNSVTPITITVKEVNKVAQITTVNVARP